MTPLRVGVKEEISIEAQTDFFMFFFQAVNMLFNAGKFDWESMGIDSLLEKASSCTAVFATSFFFFSCRGCTHH